MSRSYVIAFVVALAVAGWLASGLMAGDAPEAQQTAAGGSAEAPAVAEVAADEPLAVRVRTIVAEQRLRVILTRGRTEELRMVDLKAEIDSRVVAIAAEEGARVAKGDVIVWLDVRDREAQLAEAEALVEQRQIEYDAAKALRAKGFRAETKTAEAAALLKAAAAFLARTRLELERTVVRAPFDGVIEERFAELGDYLQDGEPVARIVDRDPLLVVAQVSEREIGYLNVGDRGEAEIITGERVAGWVRYIATTADAQTRTFRVELEIPNADLRLRAGLTAELRVSVEAVPAHFVSPAMLTLNDEGVVGVKLVTAADRVAFHPIEIVADTGDGIWLGGLPATATVITVGQEYVKHGDRVRPVKESAAPAS